MRKIVQKNEVSIMKLSARRGLECRILHHLSQSFCKGRRACSAWRRGPHQFACYFKIYWHPWYTVRYSTLQVYQRSNSQVRHIPPKMSDKFESQHSLSPTIWSDILVFVGHFGRTWEWILKDFFFTFLEVNMSNILWSMHICKRTFFPVCRMCGYVNTLVYF
jgi:hypothetical protein